MTADDWTKEMQEFAHAARIFKPATGMMANRFTSSTSSSSQLLTKSSTEEVILTRPADKAEDPALAAARMSMYGPMTRSTFTFYPTRLLCKRFNVRPPAHSEPGNDEG